MSASRTVARIAASSALVAASHWQAEPCASSTTVNWLPVPPADSRSCWAVHSAAAAMVAMGSSAAFFACGERHSAEPRRWKKRSPLIAPPAQSRCT
ncbi:MAG: hypothetical protein QM783_00910 [Phycisphaerales bacterium]